MNKNLLKELQDLIKRIEKYEVIEKDCKNSLSIQEKYNDMDQQLKNAAIVKASNVKKIEDYTKSIEQIKQQVVTEPDEAKRKELYNEMKRKIEEKEFLEINIQYRLTPQLVKESAEIELTDEYKTAYSKEWNRHSNEGMELQKLLREITKKLNADIESVRVSHPFTKVKQTAELYKHRR